MAVVLRHHTAEPVVVRASQAFLVRQDFLVVQGFQEDLVALPGLLYSMLGSPRMRN